MKKLEEKKEAFLKPILLTIAVEMRTVEETRDVISPGGDLNLALDLFVIIVANQATRNLIVDIIREIRKLKKLYKIILSTRKKIKTLLLL